MNLKVKKLFESLKILAFIINLAECIEGLTKIITALRAKKKYKTNP